MKNIPELFGSMCFNETVMRQRLPEATYKALKKTIDENAPLSEDIATEVATAMKEWAIENGAVYYTHWFQPLTGATAEKHDAFIAPAPNGQVIMEFSGKELIKGEPDASSFPSGGLRTTCEARGYTAWDPTSYAFIKNGVLCIPTAFCSFGGHALDKKTPLLRSMEAVSKQALRIVRLFGFTDIKKIESTVGAEQEYFLIDKEAAYKRKDITYTGRTLFGSNPPKGQELDDHYFGSLKGRVSDFMDEVNEELWKLGIMAKTKHNEVAPAQHELAPIFVSTNLATDQNQLTMEIMKRVALKHGMVCLLHEKPFAGVNGSGKHNNWSLSTDTGFNLLNPGKTPSENAEFLVFLCAVIKAVDEYQDLLRISAASAGNDHRLGADEAPPAVISMFLGDDLDAVLEAIEHDEHHTDKAGEKMDIGAVVLPDLPKDNTDRNRTSPFAFTGNKFEFRMVGSNQSIADANVVINTAVAKELDEFATELEQAEDFDKAVHNLLKRTIKAHKRIIFNGNGYDEAWEAEAERRGLLNLKSTVDAVEHLLDEKNVALYEKYGVYTREELEANYEIYLENYSKIIHIEASSMVKMSQKEIIPMSIEYTRELCEASVAKRAANAHISTFAEDDLAVRLSEQSELVYRATEALESAVHEAEKIEDIHAQARFYCDKVLPLMKALRKPADVIEFASPRYKWPFPTYGDLLLSVKE
ncbi:MAG: glutamine synthetase type III [Ruminococcaceae bacterium]|nr:glutamine synthetase type III [Oscillospiraceae bacterium]